MKVSRREVLLQLPETELDRIALAVQTAGRLVLGEFAGVPTVHMGFDSLAKPGRPKVLLTRVTPGAPIRAVTDLFIHPLDITSRAVGRLKREGDELVARGLPRQEIVSLEAKMSSAVIASVCVAQVFHNDHDATNRTDTMLADAETILNTTLKLMNIGTLVF